MYVFGGGIAEELDPALVAGEGTVSAGTYPGHTVPDGGYTVLELPSRESASGWAAKVAVAGRRPQEVRPFQDNPANWRAQPQREVGRASRGHHGRRAAVHGSAGQRSTHDCAGPLDQ